MEKNQQELFMQMSPFDFDREPQGWRSLSNAGRDLEAARLIQDYLAINRERVIDPDEDKSGKSLEIMQFHIGQLLAMAGIEHYPEAVEVFKLSYYKDGGTLFNEYIRATIGFLENNLSEVTSAMENIIGSKREDKRSGNLGIVKNFKKAIEIGEREYEKVYTWPRE